jgi:hypothetical protein
MMNPLTGVPTLSPLAILIDDAGGRTNHLLRETHQWTVTSELTLEWGPAEDLFSPADLEQRIVVTARTIGRQGPTATALCTLTSNATTIGYGTLRSYFVPMDGVGAEPPDRSPSSPQPQLSELMALRIQPVDGMRVLMHSRIQRSTTALAPCTAVWLPPDSNSRHPGLSTLVVRTSRRHHCG